MELSFVTIEYHCVDQIRACVGNIEKACRGISHEIVICSNSGCPLEEQASLRKEVPHANWVFRDRNGGFATGMNSGILQCRGEVMALLNPDVDVSRANVLEAFDYLKSHKNVGLIGPRIVDREGNVQDSCRKFMTFRECWTRLSGRLFHGKDVMLTPFFDYTSVQPVDWVIGAFMMVRRDALAKVGLLDQRYFLYVEDMDWCRQFWANGFRVVYYPPLEVTYKGDRKSTSGLMSGWPFNRYVWYHLSGYLRFVWKYYCYDGRSKNAGSSRAIL